MAERAFSVGGSSLAANIRKRQIGLTVTNALSFYIAEFIAAVKGFMVPALEMMVFNCRMTLLNDIWHFLLFHGMTNVNSHLFQRSHFVLPIKETNILSKTS